MNVWVGNTRYLPFPTEMGNKNERIEPAVLTINGKGLEFVSGYKRTPVKQLGGLANKELKFILVLK